MLCTVLWVQHRVVHIVQCFQLLLSRLVILCWKDWIVDVVEDHFEVLVAEGGSRSSESSFERWRHVNVSLLNLALLECWKSMFSSSVARLNSLSALKWCSITIFFRNKLFLHRVCAWAAWLHKLPCSIVSMLNTNVFRQFLRLPRSEEASSLCKTLVHRSRGNGTCSLCQQKHVLYPQVSPIDHRLVWVWIGLVWKIQHVVLLRKTVERVYQLAVVQL